MRIKVNNKIQEIENEIKVSDLLVLNNVKMPDMVSVQLNGRFIRKDDFTNTVIKEDDEIDFLYFMGGGTGS